MNTHTTALTIALILGSSLSLIAQASDKDPFRRPAAESGPVGANTGKHTKWTQIVIPEVKFSALSVQDCIEFLERKSKEVDPARKGVQIQMADSEPFSKIEGNITLSLRNATFLTALQYVTHLVNLEIIDQSDDVILLKGKSGRSSAPDGNFFVKLQCPRAD